jgi:hypothetical protein
MTLSHHAYNRIKVLPDSECLSYEGKPRFRSTAKPTGYVSFFDLRKAAEAAAMSMRGRILSRRAE